MTVIIGLEIHCQLNTLSKLFCGCSTAYHDSEPNTHVCPVCMGLPGSLPVINRKAVEWALKVGKALQCQVPLEAEFARKNYFYPDLPKGFQITMYDKPLAVWGTLLIDGDEGEKAVRITRIHLEEDPGRLVHKGGGDRPKYTLVDYNRSGTPLIEIVTEPDLRSPKEARKFLNKLRATLEYLGVFDSDREGSLRVDANISIEGSNRVEIKNISSYKGVEKALTFEVTRQKNVIRRGLKVERETRHFVETRGVTTSSRSKEEENDYRYFPEPDLPLLKVSDWVAGISLPELPDARRQRFIEQYQCSYEHAKTLTGSIRLACFYEVVAPIDAILAATWVADYLLGELNYRDMHVDLVPPAIFSELLKFLKDGTITDKNGVDVLRHLLDQLKESRECESPGACIERLELGKSAGDEMETIINTVIASHPEAVADVRSGKKGAINFLVGKVMKETRGRADPQELNRLLGDAISRLEA
jgi:aspartyl-tRNA(Asn)/glutamyl-tRNA(Gln) amidotransferase subunit B